MKIMFALAGVLCAATLSDAAIAAKPTTRNRAEIPAEYRWDFSAIYPSWEAWEEGMKQFDAQIDAFAKLKGTLARGPAALLKAYTAFDDIGKLQYRLYRYPALQRDVDTREQAVAGRFQRVTAAFARFDTASAWFTPELLNVPQATVAEWIAQTPALAPYRFPILDVYRRKAHVLDEKGERLVSLANQFSDAPPTIYQELSTSDIKFPTLRLADGSDVLLTPGNYSALLQNNRVQEERGKAAAAHVGTYGATAHTYAAIYNATLQRDQFLAQARNFDSTLDAALDANAIPPAVVETLIDATRSGAEPFRRYARLRRKLLDLPSYHLYDGVMPIYRSEATYPYEQVLKLATASVAPLGADYVAKYKRFVSSGRVDVYENEGKRSGAYSAGVYGVGPYVLMNYNDSLDAAFTLAHEAGHSMHTVLSYETQPFVTSGYTIFVAEVASTTNERFLLDEMLKHTTDPKERFLLLQHAVDSIVGTFFTQVLFADFELRAHRIVEKGQPLTTDVLNQLYAALLKEYWGDAVTVDDFYKWTWARIPHFFNTPYYVYQYATCFASSAQLYDAMTTGSPDSRNAATDRYLTLLRSGGNDHPMTQLKNAGVDLTQRATIQAVVDQMDKLVTQMETEAAKIR
ncbi:MAG: oligoendopeptidase F [Pseudomonadota bacterium]|nr:oligoendopeptidase F [Pseudomonadota bacterium]